MSRVFVVVVAVSFGITAAAYAGQIRQLADQFINSEQSTTIDPALGGQPIYQSTVKVPADVNTLEITISATGDLLDGGVPQPNSLWLNCQVDGTNCLSSGTNSAGNSVAGWVPVLSLMDSAQIPTPTAPTLPATGTDNNIHYSWCIPIRPIIGSPHSLKHQVQLSMASGDNTNTVQIEQLKVSVTGFHIGGFNATYACTSATAPAPVPVPLS